MNARTCFAAALPLLSTLFLGCNFDLHLGDSTRGVLRHAEFSYVDGDCLFGCKVDQAMMVGGQAQVTVAGADLPDELRVSQDPLGVISTSVVRSRSCCVSNDHSGGCSPIGDNDVCTAELLTTFTLTVHALKAGTTALQVFDVGGALVDFVTVEAKDPAALSVTCAPIDGGPAQGPLGTIQLGLGGACDLSVDALDEAGKTLRASAGFSLAIQDPSVSVLRPSFDLFDQLEDPAKSDVLSESTATVFARAAGTTSVNVTAGSFMQAVPVVVK